MTKRVLIFSTNYFPFVGGAEIAIKEITDRMSDYEFDMVVPRITRASTCYEKVGNVHVYRVGFGISLDKFMIPVTGMWRAWRLNRAHHYVITWSMMASQASVAAAFFKMTHKNVRLVLTLQEGDEEEHLMRYVGGNRFLYRLLIRPWYTLVFKKADMVTVISTYLGMRAKESGVRAPIVVIPNAVDTKRFARKFSDAELSVLKQQFNKKAKEIFVITTSRLVKKNAVDDIIRTMAYLPATYRLLILGTGQDESMLRALAKEQGVESRTVFVGHVDHAEIPKYLAIADVFTRPSLSEGMGNSFVEAMAAGIPVVATQVGGIADFLFDPDHNRDQKPTGLAAGPRDPKALASQIERIVSDQKLRADIIANARALVSAKYDWDFIARDMQTKAFDPA